jgi:hypothetical protein
MLFFSQTNELQNGENVITAACRVKWPGMQPAQAAFLIIHTCISAFFDILNSKMAGKKFNAFFFNVATRARQCSRMQWLERDAPICQRMFENRTYANVKMRAKRI